MQRQEIIDYDRHIWPWFTDLLKARQAKHFNTILLFVGMAGIGKSYGALRLCEVLDDSFNIDRVTFTPSEFIRVTNNMRTGQWVMIDEPALSGILGKRSWYMQMQQALVDQLETFRFRQLGTALCCINRNLLDKTVREYLIHYVVIMQDRGFARIYEMEPSQFHDQIFTPLRGETYLEMPSSLLVEQYEMKRAAIQKSRYVKSLEEIEVKEDERRTFRDIVAEARERIEELQIGGKVSSALIREKLGVGLNQARDIAKILKTSHTPTL